MSAPAVIKGQRNVPHYSFARNPCHEERLEPAVLIGLVDDPVLPREDVLAPAKPVALVP
jgi:hypothetical protein